MFRSLPVHMLWVSGPLSRLARLSLASFLNQGYRVTLWTYDRAPLAGSGAALRDAGEIAPFNDELAALSNLFRYRLLATHGGIWSDTDMVALAAPTDFPEGPLIASEKRRPFRYKETSATGESLTQVTNCFMANPTPHAGDLWHRAADAVAILSPDELSWETTGPHLLTRLMLDGVAHGVSVLPAEAACPVAWWNVPAYFLEQRDLPPSPFLHLYNSIWNKRGVDPEAAFPPHSLAGRLWQANGL